MKRMASTKRATAHEVVEDDTRAILSGIYAPKDPPMRAIDDLVRAYRREIVEFARRFQKQMEEGKKMTRSPLSYDPKVVHKTILRHLLDNYGIEKSLAVGIADQIVWGEND